jgi:hypothetical protein
MLHYSIFDLHNSHIGEWKLALFSCFFHSERILLALEAQYLNAEDLK